MEGLLMKYKIKCLADTIGLFLIYLAIVVAFRNMVDESYIATIIIPGSIILMMPSIEKSVNNRRLFVLGD